VSSHRARANHSLYCAGMLISSWRGAQDAGNFPATALNDAFLPAVHLHLRQAYGWFLLELSGAGDWGSEPPAGTAELPPVPAGKAIPAEVREFQRLESDGWVGEFLSALSPVAPARPARSARAQGGLAVAAVDDNDCEAAAQWKRKFESLFDRMGDALDEC